MTLPFEIGVTGGIGVGKSVVCQIFKCLGVPVYNADSRAKHLMSTEIELGKQIEKEWGNPPCDQEGSLNKKMLRKFFSHPEQLKKLNALVHPWVSDDYNKWRSSQKNNLYIIKEAALLIEVGLSKKLHKLIVVSSPLPLRMQRILARDPFRSEKEVYNIMKSQMGEEEKIKYADNTIVNDETQMIVPQVWELHQSFITTLKLPNV